MNAPVPPRDLDAEDSVLGAMMLSAHVIEPCSEILNGREFFRASNGIIFKAILSLWEKGEPADGITVVEQLTRDGLLEAANGADRVRELSAIVPAASNAAHYARIVREMWIARSLISAGNEIVRLGFDRPGNAEELVAQADEQMLEVQGFVERKSDSVFTGKQLVEQFRHRLANPEDASVGIKTPFPEFFNPLKDGRLYVLGGHPKDGKSAMSLQFLRSACEGGARVGFASIEMNRDDLTDRLVATFGVPSSLIQSREIGRYEEVAEDALGQIEGWDFEIIDDHELTPSGIQRAQRRGKYDFLIVDHLHRIRVKDKRHEREEIADNVLRICNISTKFEIPVLLLSQLSRGPKHDPYPRPSMDALYGASAIEKEASMVMFVWRKREQGVRTSVAEIIVAANRFGHEDFRNLTFNERFVRFDPTTSQTEGAA